MERARRAITVTHESIDSQTLDDALRLEQKALAEVEKCLRDGKYRDADKAAAVAEKMSRLVLNLCKPEQEIGFWL